MCRSRPGRARRSSPRQAALRDASVHPASERRTVSAVLTRGHTTRSRGAPFSWLGRAAQRAKTTSVSGSDPVDAERVVGALHGPEVCGPSHALASRRDREVPRRVGVAAIGVDTRTTTAHRQNGGLRVPTPPGRARARPALVRVHLPYLSTLDSSSRWHLLCNWGAREAVPTHEAATGAGVRRRARIQVQRRRAQYVVIEAAAERVF